MLGEGAADQVVPVADALPQLAVAGEQQPRVLEAAAAEREDPRPDGEAGVAGRRI
jgi:hypothetical protein